MLINDFSKLDAQDEMSRLAQVRSDEQDPAEFDAWQMEVAQANLSADPVATGEAPRS